MTPRTVAEIAWEFAKLAIVWMWISAPFVIWLHVRAVRSMLEALIAQGVTP